MDPGSFNGRLQLLEASYFVCRLPPTAPSPPIGGGDELLSVTRTEDEVSIVCAEERVPEGARREGPWKGLRVAGTLHLDLVGVLESLCAPLARVGVSVFAISTWNTDYLFVRRPDLDTALAALEGAGWAVERP